MFFILPLFNCYSKFTFSFLPSNASNGHSPKLTALTYSIAFSGENPLSRIKLVTHILLARLPTVKCNSTSYLTLSAASANFLQIFINNIICYYFNRFYSIKVVDQYVVTIAMLD